MGIRGPGPGPAPQSHSLDRLSKASLVLWLSILLAGCATWPDRPAISAETAAAASVTGLADIRLYADDDIGLWLQWRARWQEDRQHAGSLKPIQTLAISSGSDKGAFAAGLLNGWSEAGIRPTFSLVTGTSTGALIAPFAFLGSRHDGTLRAMYTTVSAKDIYRKHPVEGLLGGASLADTAPLADLIERYLTDRIVEDIAEEHRKGRRLLIQTTNLDAQRGVVWDIGAIATSADPGKAALIRRILLASASIPGIFPPVLIDADSNGQHLTEMHVDGGTIASMFVVPTAVMWSDDDSVIIEAPKSIDIIYNGPLLPRYEVVEPRTFTIIKRALDTAIGAADRQSMAAYTEFAKRRNVRFSIWAIGEEFPDEEHSFFDPEYMAKLFEYGRAKASGQ